MVSGHSTLSWDVNNRAEYVGFIVVVLWDSWDSPLRYLAPAGSLKLTEKAWNCSEYCRTVITNPGYMKENFLLKIETMCVENDRGDRENVHELSAEQLKVRRVAHSVWDTRIDIVGLSPQMRKVVHIDIANDPIPSGDPNVPGRTQITKTDPPIGPLSGNWRQTVTPVMTVYKLVCFFVNAL